MKAAIIGIVIGLAAGAFNYWLLRTGLPRPSERPPEASGPAGPTGSRESGRQAGVPGLARRMLLRTFANLGALFVAFIFLRDQWAILGTLFGLLIFPTVTVMQLYYEGRARRR